jgi:hypothetical protein
VSDGHHLRVQVSPLGVGAKAFEWQGGTISVVSLAGLAKMKRLAGRKQDLADLEQLGIEDEEK